MKTLSDRVITGWPADKKKVPNRLTPFWSIRDEMSISNGIINKGGNQAIIPTSMQKDIKIHSSDFGAETCIHMCKYKVYWSSMQAAIRNQVIVENGIEKKSENLLSQPVPDYP